MAGYHGSGAGVGHSSNSGMWDRVLIPEMMLAGIPIRWRPGYGHDDEIPDLEEGGIGGPGTPGGGPDCGPVINWHRVRETVVLDRHLLDTVMAARRFRGFEGLDVVPRESEATTQHI